MRRKPESRDGKSRTHTKAIHWWEAAWRRGGERRAAHWLYLAFAGMLFLCAFLVHSAQAGEATAASVASLFRKPSRDYSTAPLWVWNDQLTEQEIRGTMQDLAGQKVKQVFVHPRPGLMTPYLSEEWFRLWQVALKEAARLDMNVWIYDENSYPSGFAGGWVPELMPESRGRGLAFSQSKSAPKPDGDASWVFELSGQQYSDVTEKVRAGTASAEGQYLVATIKRASNQPWNGDRCYVDLLYPGVVEKFLATTHEAYRREIGKQFGKRVPGSFTDEPELRPAGGLPWTEDLPAVFEKRWGYSLVASLPGLSQPVGDWKRVRHNYWQVLNTLFVDRWARPYHDYCASNHLEFTGHYWEHDWPQCGAVPDNMTMYSWQHRPGIDCLMNQYRADTHGQFGNVRAVRELASVANQLGLPRTLCEAYGAGGWDLRFEDMKRIGDWLTVLGVNTIDQHLSYITIRGARKRDHPQSFSYHEPWWEAYHISAEYLARLSAALSQGDQVNDVLVLEPTTTAWMYQGDDKALNQLGKSFFDLLMSLEMAQVEYDIGCEDIMRRLGAVEGSQFRVGHRSYQTVVIPPGTENFNTETMKLLKQFAKAGGTLLDCGLTTPVRVDGLLDPSPPTLECKAAAPGELAQVLRQAAAAQRFEITRLPEDKGILFHQRRRLEDGELLFLVNTSLENVSGGAIESGLNGIESWDPATGAREAYPFENSGRGIRAEFRLPAAGSLLLFLSQKPAKPSLTPWIATRALPAVDPLEANRLEPNVLILDYVNVTAGGETKSNIYFYAANKFAFQKNGLERNPWDSAVQFRDEIIRKTFPTSSGFEASYKFRIEEKLPAKLELVLERPDLYGITCNGRPVTARTGDWWLDKSFGRIEISDAVQLGENVVTIKASPFTIYHELESAYIIGDFRLEPVEHGFAIHPDKPIVLGKWNEQGAPLYGGGVGYVQRFSVDKTGERFMVRLGKWNGSVARVRVNGKAAGYIGWAPWECDVTKWIKRGENRVEVAVIGTLKNTLGPHHGKPALGAAWPAQFQAGPNNGPPPGMEYSTVGYGLFEPFQLWQSGIGARPSPVLSSAPGTPR